MLKTISITELRDNLAGTIDSLQNLQTIMVLRNSKYGLFYGCSTYPNCKASHGAHKDGKPLGTPAACTPRKELRTATSS